MISASSTQFQRLVSAFSIVVNLPSSRRFVSNSTEEPRGRGYPGGGGGAARAPGRPDRHVAAGEERAGGGGGGAAQELGDVPPAGGR